MSTDFNYADPPFLGPPVSWFCATSSHVLTCKVAVFTPHTRHNWTTLAAYRVTLKYSVTSPYQCRHSHNENVPLLHLLSEIPPCLAQIIQGDSELWCILKEDFGEIIWSTTFLCWYRFAVFFWSFDWGSALCKIFSTFLCYIWNKWTTVI